MAAISPIAGNTGHQHNRLARKRHQAASHGAGQNASRQQARADNRAEIAESTYTYPFLRDNVYVIA